MENFDDLLELAVLAAKEASKEILEVYNSKNFEIEIKSDRSPLTIADKRSHERITEILKSSSLPILSEEGKEIPYSERSKWDLFWMVDPIDGTKEFIKRNGEFTVNIALIKGQEPVLGVVLVPVSEEVYWGKSGYGAFKDGKKIRVNSYSFKDSRLKVVASRSHLNDETRTFIDNLHDPVIISKGSSLKLLLVAEGEADVYPRYAPTMEWDTAAAHAILKEAGGRIVDRDDNELMYNKKDLLNSHFICQGRLDK